MNKRRRYKAKARRALWKRYHDTVCAICDSLGIKPRERLGWTTKKSLDKEVQNCLTDETSGVRIRFVNNFDSKAVQSLPVRIQG